MPYLEDGTKISTLSRELEQANKLMAHTVDWSLTTELFKHFGSTSESITRFADRNVQDQLVDTEFPHRV